MTDRAALHLTASNLTVTRGDATLVRQASLELRSGEFVVLLGPNGAGKSSLIRAMLNLIAVDSGQSKIGETQISDMTPQRRARCVSYLPQSRSLAWPIRVEDVVALGRFAYGASSHRLSDDDRSAIDAALTACRIDHLRGRSSRTLSGGEQARMHLARALAAQADFLIADEPVAALDPFHQFEVMSVLRRTANNGSGVLAVLHDIDLAAQFADRLVWMADGAIRFDGPPSETLTVDVIRQLYRVDAEIEDGRVRLSPA